MKKNDMREEYTKELKALEQKMIKAEEFAKKLPIFADIILKEKHNENDNNIHFGYKYKNLYLAWGIKRYNYGTSSRAEILNLSPELSPKKDNFFLFNIYVNCYSLFGLGDNDYTQARNSLDELKFDVFFYDKHNTTFYATDEQIENLLEKLNDWYIEQCDFIKKESNKKKIEEMKKEIEKLENKMEEEFEREIFEKWIGSPPFEHSCERNSESSAWPGSYKRYETELAWEAWKERANYALTNKS